MPGFGSVVPLPQPPGREVLSVSDLARRARTILESEIGPVWVRGEISNFVRSQAGHCYFSLKDEKSQVRCVLFARSAAAVRFQMEDGLAVEVHGDVSLYEPRGDFQIRLDRVEPVGKGALQLAFEQLKAKLEAEGLFAPERKRPLPWLPRRIGIVTSTTGAALRDILQILDRRWPVPVVIANSRVQGEGAAEEIAAGIATVNLVPEVDVVIVGRGGGSAEDLWAFNEEIVARAILASRIPVVSAVGHEIDVTIADLVADRRALTPSEAAELVVPVRSEVLGDLESARQRLLGALRAFTSGWRTKLDGFRDSYALRHPAEKVRQLQQRLDDVAGLLNGAGRGRLAAERSRLDLLAGKLGALHPAGVFLRWKDRLDGLAGRLALSGRNRLAGAGQTLQGLAARLQGLSPLAVLQRGYSLTRRHPEGTLVRKAADAPPGTLLHTRLAVGEVFSRVEGSAPASPAVPPAARRVRTGGAAPSAPLFEAPPPTPGKPKENR